MNRRTQLLKFVYSWLPIGVRRVTIEPLANSLCPSCLSAEETHDHILQCPQTQRRGIADSFITTIAQIGEANKIDTRITQAIQFHVKKWIYSTTSLHTSSDRRLEAAIQEQNTIGWNNFLRGFISKKFETVARQSSKPLSRYESFKWTAQLIRAIWDQELDQWRLRNATVHGDTIEIQSQKTREKLITEANALYISATDLPFSDRQQLFRHWPKVLEKKNRPLRIWLQTTKKTVHYLLDARKQPDNDPT